MSKKNENLVLPPPSCSFYQAVKSLEVIFTTRWRQMYFYNGLNSTDYSNFICDFGCYGK